MYLIVVCGLFFLAQIVLVVRVTPLGWDEKVYVGQFAPWTGRMLFTAPRSRGMPLIVAPLVQVTSSLAVLRTYLALLSAVGMYVGFGAWLRLRNSWTVALAALMFGSLWTTVFYAPSAMPNVPVAMCAVAVTGWAVRAALGEPGRRILALVFAGLALAALVRPGDALQLLIGLGAVVLLLPAMRVRRWPVLLAAVGGAAAGALPWLVEAQLRYGGIAARIRAALGQQSTGERFVPDYTLRAADGPLLCRPCVRADQPIAWWVLAWWITGALLVVLALVSSYRRGHQAENLAPALVGAAFALPYLLLVGYSAPRFLLPSYALLAIPAAAGVGVLVARLPTITRPGLLAVGAVTLVLFWHVQVGILDQESASLRRSNARAEQAVGELRAAGVIPRCTLIGTYSTPVGFLAGCASVALARPGRGHEVFTLQDLRRRITTQHVAVVLRAGAGRPSYARGWIHVPSSRFAIWAAPAPRPP